MPTDDHYVTPEPSDDNSDNYEDPLEEWVGETIIAEWAGQRVKGVVVDVELDHDGHRFGEYLLVSAGEDKATISVEPDDILAAMSDI